MIPERSIYSVSEINEYIKSSLNLDQNLRFISVKGEISNYKFTPGGHLYFSIKDNKSIINAVMFSNYANKISFNIKDGDNVVVLASIDVYVPRGSYQLICFQIEQTGEGDILLELQKLKKKLQEEGLFDPAKKRPINIFPKSIGVITARNSAAIKDILFNIKRRYPIADVFVFYSSVQGENAKKELLSAFNESQKYDLDTLIIGRGGGAQEDLSAFNDEILVRAIANSKFPVIAAIGHEIDYTLVDYVADKRASTPTGAAELATIDKREIQQQTSYAYQAIHGAILDKVDEIRENINVLKERIDQALSDKINDYKQTLILNKEKLIALNPKNVLSRGYSITFNANRKTINSINDIKEGEEMITILKDGTIFSKVIKK